MEGALEEKNGRKRSPEHWLVVGGALLGLVLLIVLGFVLQPDERGFGTHEKLGLAPCLPMKLWNVPCPGCGVTTSVSMAAHGDFWSSIKNQPFGFLVALGIAAFAIWAPFAHSRGRDLWVWLQGVRFGRWSTVLIAIAAVSWIYKFWLVRQ